MTIVGFVAKTRLVFAYMIICKNSPGIDINGGFLL